jgi:F-type H+-transporting ATPase subunit gamma
MSSLKQLRSRIKSVASTQKITAAMKMVAAAKLRRVQEQAENASPFRNEVLSIVQKVINLGDLDKLPKIVTGSNEPPLFILYAADRGLCGGFNATMFKTFKNTVEPLIQNQQKFFCIAIGTRALNFLKKNYGSYLMNDMQPQNVLTDIESFILSKKIRNAVEIGSIGRVEIIYTSFKNVVTLIPTVTTLVPLSKNRDDKLSEDHLCLFEPEAPLMLDDLIQLYLSSEIYTAKLQSNTCEHAARMTAMDNSTRNAKDIVSKLKLTYNRTRQAIITKELIEIISGAKATTN